MSFLHDDLLLIKWAEDSSLSYLHVPFHVNVLNLSMFVICTKKIVTYIYWFVNIVLKNCLKRAKIGRFTLPFAGTTKS